MSGSLSQPCSAPSMTRTISRATISAGNSIPFVDTGRAPPRLQKVDNRREPSVIDSWATRQDDPINAYTFAHQGSLRLSSSQVIPELEQVTEMDMDIGEDPAEYFARTSLIGGTMNTISVSPSPIDIPPGSQWRSTNQHRQSMSSRRNQTFGIQTPTTPNSATLTTATTFTSELSRQSSYSNDAILGPFEMLNVHSNTSNFTDNAADETLFHSGIPFSSSSYPKLHSSNEEQTLLLLGTGGASHDSHISLLYDVNEANAPFTSSTVEDMIRSQSKESSVSSSSSSSKSRSVAQLQRLNQQAARPIAPKAGGDENSMSRKGSLHTMLRINSRDGKEERVVAAIPKTPYQRPKHDRVYCNLCSDYPDGFRGAHELGRHQDRQHKDNVRKFVCIEPADGIIHPQFQPVNSLLKCKSCSQQKHYGAYYNAAAHLRRAHFRPRSRGRGKNTKVDDKSEKRGGKGGGDWPPMNELRRWMKEVCEIVSENQQPQADDDDNEGDDDCCGNGFDEDAILQMSNRVVGQPQFDNSYHYSNDTAMLDSYPTPLAYDIQGMSNIQFEQLSHQQNIDLQPNSSQSSFADSQFTSMHDPMAYIDSFPQNFEDQSLRLGPDLLNIQYNM
jgi:hypothetical protein